jgi:catechol 2,3-dioxygenase-like lactoylglutathione lyase family enzyme
MISEAMLGGLMAMRPTLPAKDYAQSIAFYERIGFSAWPLGDRLSHLQLGNRDGLFCFLLQDAYTKDWAENVMMLLTVNKLDPWWDHITGLKLDETFGTPKPLAPRLEPWGLRVAYFHDPAGILWHVAEQDGFPDES